MSYTLQFKNQLVDAGKTPIIVPVGTTDSTSTDLALTGKGAANYGTFQQQNLLRLLENFADYTAPTNPTVGQIWYDATNLTLKVLIDKSPSLIWKSIGGVQVTDVGVVPPAPAALGDVWFERAGTASGFLYVYTGIGRYPTTATTVGGWDQIWPQVETFGGRDEYDMLRQLVDQLAGSPTSTFGSGAITRYITNLTNFGELDRNMRAKYKALLPLDANVLYSPASGAAVDREITTQAISSTLFYYNDSASPSDGYIGGFSADPSLGTPLDAGSIYIDGVITSAPFGILGHGAGQVVDAFILWDRANSFLPGVPGGGYFVARVLNNGQWQYDNGSVPNSTAWTSFTPVANQYVIGSISTLQEDNNNVYPVDKTAFMWMHAVPLLGTKVEHLKVEPNSQDWDALLACAKYAINRLEVPATFVRAVSPVPFVSDGRQVNSTLLGLNSQTDVRYPSAARRSGRKAGAVTQVQNFAETINALNVGIENRFSLLGINGASGSNPTFASTTTIGTHCTPTDDVRLTGSNPGGSMYFRMKFRFSSMEHMNRFLGGAGAIQLEITHDTASNLQTMLSQAGTWRITGDKTRIFGQSLPLTITQPTVNVGIWNGNTAGVQLNSVTISGATLAVSIRRVSNTQFDLEFTANNGGALSGNTSVTIKTITGNETYNLGDEVYPKPLAFVGGGSDVVDPV